MVEMRTILFFAPGWCDYALSMGKQADVCAAMIEADLRWEQIDPLVDEYAATEAGMRPRDSLEQGPYWGSVDYHAWGMKAVWILMSPELPAGLSTGELLQQLPSLEQLVAYGTLMPANMMHICWAPGHTIMLMAWALEHLGDFEQALSFAAKALDTDITQAGTPLHSVHINAKMLRGRCLAKKGLMVEAKEAFESAAELSTSVE